MCPGHVGPGSQVKRAVLHVVSERPPIVWREPELGAVGVLAVTYRNGAADSSDLYTVVGVDATTAGLPPDDAGQAPVGHPATPYCLTSSVAICWIRVADSLGLRATARRSSKTRLYVLTCARLSSRREPVRCGTWT